MKTRENHYERPISSGERIFLYSPFSVVTVAARIKGLVTAEMFNAALVKVQQRHRVLRLRIIEDEIYGAKFTSEDVGDLEVEFLPRQTDDQWLQVMEESSRIVFHFDRQPPIKFTLLHAEAESDLIIACHHIICDGLSLAQLLRDVLQHLGDPGLEVDVLPAIDPVGLDTLPPEVSLNRIVKFFVRRINKKWSAEKVVFDQEDYWDLHAAYWQNFNHQMVAVTLTEAQTSALVERCRTEGVTVNSALAAAAVGAQAGLLDAEQFNPSIGIAGNLRDRLKQPVGEGLGFYAGVVTLEYKYDTGKGFWDNARSFHRKIVPLYTNEKLFADFLSWSHLEPGILEGVNFKKLGSLVSPDANRYEKLSAFSSRDDVILSILRRDKMETLDRTLMGTAITNLTRLDFPKVYGELELEQLVFKPGGAFPLSNINLLVGAVTCSGRLSLVLEFADKVLDPTVVEQIKTKTLAFLLE